MSIEEIIKKNHGNSCILWDPETSVSVIKTYQDMLDAGEYDESIPMFYGDLSPEECAARDAYNTLRDNALRQWLTSVTREEMLGMLGALSKISGGGYIQWMEGETLWCLSLASKWNECNPLENPILFDNSPYLP